MRIGIDARLWNETGVGRYTRNLVRNLLQIDKQNEYVLFALSKDRDVIKSQVLSPKSQVITADIRWHSVAEQREFPKILNSANLDLMHFPYFSVPLLYNKPFVVTIHDLILHHFSTGEASTLPLPVYKLKHSFYKQVVKSAAKRAKKVITVSRATKKEIVDHLGVPEEKVLVTYEGFDLHTELKANSSKLKANSSKLKANSYFLHVGNVYPHKNTAMLLEAFEIFLNSHPERSEGSKKDSSLSAQNDTHLLFVGKDDYFMKKLKKRVHSSGLEKHIEFVGEVDDEKLSGLYQHAIALVSPSLMEGFGLPAVEAMANNCLVVVSDIPVYKEVCGDAPFYCNPTDVKDIANALQTAYTLSEKQKQEKVARGRGVIKRYSWAEMSKKTLEIYESCFSLRQS